ncbi:peroxide stress protein YaaA [Austwickia chelonae]|uniref:YaaA family protein n=1 Tax=Austwickia chelonae TaxID=100225 RepID=UPI001F07F46F
MDLAKLSFPSLTHTRENVLATLAEASARPDALSLLKLGISLKDELTRNLRLGEAPASLVSELYSGVLYDALDLKSLDTAGRNRATRWIVIASALYGALRLTDKVAPYRLSMGVALPGMPKLAKLWRTPLQEALTPVAARGVIVDCRSAIYQTAWPVTAELAERWVHVRVPGASHQAKHTRGLVARTICASGIDAKTPIDLAAQLAGDFDVELISQARPRQSWTLDVHRPV